MAHQDHLVQLVALLDERLRRLPVVLGAGVLQADVERDVVRLRQVDAGEQVRQDALKQGDIGRQELGRVDVLDGAQHEHILRHCLAVLLLVGRRGAQHRDDGAHAVVVVALAGQLLGAQLVGGHQLARQVAGLQVAGGVEHDLRDHGVVGHHHGDGAEQRLQVVGQLGAAGVAGVHRDVHVALRVQVQLRVLEHEALHLGHDGQLDGQNLLRHDRQHLQVDAVELVEAGPGAGGGQALEELAHRQVVQAVGAVEDDALHGDRLGQVLRRLRLAGAGGPLGRAAQVQVQRAHERAVAAVRQRRDDQARAVAQVLVAVGDGGVDHAHHDVPILPVVPQLAHPLKVRLGGDARRRQLGHRVARVHVDDDERRQRLALQLGQLAAHLADDLRSLDARGVCGEGGGGRVSGWKEGGEGEGSGGGKSAAPNTPPK